MRLFVALEPSGAAREALGTYAMQLRKAGVRGNFSRRENLHITLAFLGEQPGSEEAAAALREMAASPFQYTLSRRGVFRREGGDILYLAPEDDTALCALAAVLWDALARHGFSREIRPFTAHLTLGRELRGLAAAAVPAPRLSLEVAELVLMQSARSGGVLTYTPLYRRALQ